MSDLAGYFAVFIGSMFKFILGPVSGMAADLSFFEIFFFTVLGMMTTVVLVVYVGERIKNWFNRTFRAERKLFTPRNRKIVMIWKRFGIPGIAFITPLLLSPIGGALIAVAFGGNRKKIISYMAVSALFWGGVFSLIFKILGDKWLH